MQTILCINCHTSCCNLLCSGILCASGMRRGRRWRCGPPQPHFLENQNLRHPSTAPPPAPPPFSSAPCCPGTAPYRTGPMPPRDHPVATTPGPHFCSGAPLGGGPQRGPSRCGLVAAGPFSAFFLFPNIFDRFSAHAIRSILYEARMVNHG
jgi:hypothetical protein